VEWSGQILKSRELGFGCAMDLCVKQKTELISGASVTSTASCRRQVNVAFTATVSAQLAPAAQEASKTINVVTLAAAINTVIDAQGWNGTLSYLNSSSINYVSEPVISTNGDSHSGLSGADIAGIVVGTIVGVLMLAGVMWYVTVSTAADPTSADPTSKEPTPETYNHAKAVQTSCC